MCLYLCILHLMSVRSQVVVIHCIYYMSIYHSSQSNSSSRQLRNHRQILSTNPNIKDETQERIRAKLLKYKAKVAHYQIMLQDFFQFVELKINKNNSKNRDRTSYPLQQVQGLKEYELDMGRQLELQIKRLAQEKKDLQSQYEQLQEEFQRHRKKFKKDMNTLQRENQAINRELGRAQIQINQCQYSDLDDFKQAKRQYLDTVRMSEKKMEEVESLYRQLMVKQVNEIMEKQAIKRRLQMTKNQLEDKVSQRHKMKEKSKNKINVEKKQIRSKKEDKNKQRLKYKGEKNIKAITENIANLTDQMNRNQQKHDYEFQPNIAAMNKMRQFYLKEKNQLKTADQMIMDLEQMYSQLSSQTQRETLELHGALGKLKTVNKRLQSVIEQKRKIMQEQSSQHKGPNKPISGAHKNKESQSSAKYTNQVEQIKRGH